jgi:hypothetical protein
MEFQLREGFCGPTTVRNLLVSLNVIKISLPPLKSGPVDAAKVKEMIDKSTHGRTKTRIIYGDHGYAKFLDGIRASNNERYRVTINFLRGALFGSSSFWPHNWLLAALGGHFSNVLGYLEELNLVVIFDVNQEYGLFLVDAHRLYTSVFTPDFSFSNVKSRGILVTEIVD